MTSTTRLWFTLFAVVGLTSGLMGVTLLWLLVTRPVLVVQAVAAWW